MGIYIGVKHSGHTFCIYINLVDNAEFSKVVIQIYISAVSIWVTTIPYPCQYCYYFNICYSIQRVYHWKDVTLICMHQIAQVQNINTIFHRMKVKIDKSIIVGKFNTSHWVTDITSRKKNVFRRFNQQNSQNWPYLHIWHCKKLLNRYYFQMHV